MRCLHCGQSLRGWRAWDAWLLMAVWFDTGRRKTLARLTTNGVGPTIGSVAWVNGVAGRAQSVVCRWVPAEDAGMTGARGVECWGCGQNVGGDGAWWWCEELFWVMG